MTNPNTNTKRLAGWTGLALVAVIGVGSVAGSNSARADLMPKAYQALVDNGLSNVKLDFDGREAKLSNGTPEELARAEKIVEAVDGVRWAKIDADGDSSLPKPPSLSLTLSGDGYTLSGVVPNDAIAAELKSAAASLGAVAGGLKVDPEVGTADWLAVLPKLIPSLNGVRDLALSVDGDSVAIGGKLATQGAVDLVTGLVEPAVPGLALDNTLKVDSTALTTEQADEVDAANVYFPRGSSTLDAKGKAALLKLADVLLQVPGVELEIGGHAGPADPARGKILSDERVAAVKDFLVASGVDASRLSTRSYGSDPETDGDAFAEQYRRVDFIVKGN